MKTQVILDAGHRPQTKGKRSPDGRLVEHQWALECREAVAEILRAAGVDVAYVEPTSADTEARDLNARVRAVNSLHSQRRSVAVSIHCNAAGVGGWNAARGWSVFVAPNASQASKQMAEAMAARARAEGLKVRTQQLGVGYWTQSLAFCRDTKCAAVLVENLFMDNPADLEILLSAEGKAKCARAVACGVIDFLRSWGE